MSEKMSESQATVSEDAHPIQGLYDEVNRIRGQVRTVSVPEQIGGRVSIGQALEQDLVTIDDSIYEQEQSKARVINAVFNIREATEKNYIIDLGTDEARINNSLVGLSPDERKQANALYFEKNGVPILHDLNDELSGADRALSVSLLEWPNENGKNAQEFWENMGSFGSGDRIIVALSAMTREEIEVLLRAQEASYGVHPLFEPLSRDKDRVLRRVLPLLEMGKDQRDVYDSRKLLSLLMHYGRYDTLLAVADNSPQSDRRWLANLPKVKEKLRDELGEKGAKEFLEALRK